jgi:glycosyltransferase involved in cell wall biosynthesis
MRILQVINSDETGGIRTLAGAIEAGLARNGITVETVYVFSGTASPRGTRLLEVFRTAVRLSRSRADVLLAYQATSSILVGLIGRLSGARVRIVHQTALPGETRWALRRLDRLLGSLGFYTANVANTEATLAAFRSYPKAYRRAMRLIAHGVRPRCPSATPADTLRRFGIGEGAVLLNVGRCVPQKNQAVLVEALRGLPSARLVIAGGGPLDQAYRRLARTRGVEGRLHLLGNLCAQDVAEIYAAADIFVFPSVWETFGLAAVEAAMAGLPVVATDLPVLREVLDGYGAARFVSADDVEGWRNELGALIASRPSLEKFDGTAAHIREKYSEERMIGAYLRLLDGYPALREV